MTDMVADLAASPALYPWSLDLERRAVLLVRMDEADYRASSFLDERIVTRDRRGQWLALAALDQALGARRPAPLHFIFHCGHVGSTLLSRLLDESDRVLSLREPVPLRLIAQAHDAGAPDLDALLESLLGLWERGFPHTDAVVLKATSAAERLAPRLLTLRPRARAVMLNVAAETYLATMLAGENSATELNAQGPERFHRLSKLLGAPPPRPATLGQLAAMSWLAERLTQRGIELAFPERVLSIDFDAMLRGLDVALGRVFAHFQIPLAAERVAAIAGGPVLSRYSKAPEHGHSPRLRGELLAQARGNYPNEIRTSLGWLAALAQSHPVVAALL